jgi:hypothetical protein
MLSRLSALPYLLLMNRSFMGLSVDLWRAYTECLIGLSSQTRRTIVIHNFNRSEFMQNNTTGFCRHLIIRASCVPQI